MGKDIFVYGLSDDTNPKLLVESNINMKVQGALVAQESDTKGAKDFIERNIKGANINYSDIHSFCTKFLIADMTGGADELKKTITDAF